MTSAHAADDRVRLRGIVATRFELADAESETLRAIVATIERAMAVLPATKAPGENATTREVLAASWGDLVRLFALRPEPEVRVCPGCGYLSMRAATVCGQCWRKLPPAILGTEA